MQNDRFIRVMHRVFSWLFFGQITLLVLSVILMVVAFTRQENRVAPLSKRIRYDTLLTRNGEANFTPPALSNGGQLISKVRWHDGYLIYFGENGQQLSRLRLDKLAQTPSLPQLRRKHARQIDSALVANPDVEVVQLPDRWVIRPHVVSGYLFSARLPFYGFFTRKTNYRALTPAVDWRRTITLKPDAEVKMNTEWPTQYLLTINIRRWSDLTPDVWPVMALTLLISMVSGLVFILIVYWFRAIFSDLARGHYFEEHIVQRVRYIGWLFIAAFVFKNGIDMGKPYLAQHFLSNHGYEYIGGWTWDGPDYWLWLWAGLILLVFARIFSYGIQLQREHDLTI